MFVLWGKKIIEKLLMAYKDIMPLIDRILKRFQAHITKQISHFISFRDRKRSHACRRVCMYFMTCN